MQKQDGFARLHHLSFEDERSGGASHLEAEQAVGLLTELEHTIGAAQQRI